ncbi:hypothetical protein [Lacihabitans soyangensis]|uniref:Uncharacterized protein n=1 Tax=Lacihabitans soyangensis TaxID=869394 RepID=A0AAE3KS82_9BACT|nr:hypothetical protein [Lacihabitans soyangensis]MCP9762309.1 hypothetical protein [Lacihabitans soyangensis]
MDTFFEFPHEQNKQSSKILEQPIDTNYESFNVQQYRSSVPSENKQFNDSKEEFDAVVKASKDMDDRLKIYLEQNEGAVRKIFPSKMQKLVAQKERLMVGSALDFRLGLLKLGNEFRLEAMRDRYDTYLKAYKGENRLQLTKFMIGKVNELYRVVKTEEIAGIRELEEMYKNAATINEPSIKSKYIARIGSREDKYLNVIEKLMSHFEAILDENLSRPSFN